MSDGQDDIGTEMNERELRDVALDEPADSEMIGMLVAEIGYLADDLAQPAKVKVMIDEDREYQVDTLVLLDKALLLLNTIRDEVAQALAGMMEEDVAAINGHAVTRSRSGDKVEWDKDGAWRAVKFAIIDELVSSRDHEHALLVERTMAKVKTAGGFSPLVNGLKALGVDAWEYRAVSRGTRFNVKVS